MGLLANSFRSNLAFLTKNWHHMLGRPNFTMIAHTGMMDNTGLRAHFNIEKFVDHKNAYILAVRS
jgi:hypothetical protein